MLAQIQRQHVQDQREREAGADNEQQEEADNDQHEGNDNGVEGAQNNNGGSDSSSGEEEEDGELGAANVGMAEHLIGLHKGENLYALRDIDAGEQILVNYGEFAVPEGWKEFGL